ncbi:MAG: hypothetical protein A2309_09355 [Bacteroidetes bacterium RIFOXYB2_FULL_35_7]|nr:MAG: hypothetical protein A2X01_14845 [Bacteroidetes bacterium GWF2_35_48]OFY92887.1 MAG: hypothetical protein A2309_09355 [Bacteroidetes bacterium RIFOXYB2_FULL_35_7]OFY97176.1 MAG: hypothetical protein A2491_21420 [Bacteroidetes bacterium RIFOXYC12_FULL_35_7]HBX50125.1 hypothetical protein [Bacteroidales bacterium]
MEQKIIQYWKERARKNIFPFSQKAHFILNLFVDYMAGKESKESVIQQLQQKNSLECSEFNYYIEALQDLEQI